MSGPRPPSEAPAPPPPGERDARALLQALFDAALAAVSPAVCLTPWIDGLQARRRSGRLAVLAVGKAGASMLDALAAGLDRPFAGLVVTPPGYGPPPSASGGDVARRTAGHPTPDAGSLAAGDAALALAAGLGEGDHLLALVSGGGSALMCAPAPGVDLSDKQALTRDLLRCGAAISEINCVRKHLSRVKGGRLALAAFPATVETLAVSDIPGDDPLLIASGPTLPDPTTLADARGVLARHGLSPAPSILAALSDPANESLKPDHPLAGRLGVQVIARSADALEAARRLGVRSGRQVTVLGDRLEGEARSMGAAHAALALARSADDGPALILSGGETTVTVTHADGRGGPNLEYLLALAIALDGAPGIFAIACDTDGQDGSEPVAGAVVTPSTLSRARGLGLDARRMLMRNDSYGFFAALDDLVVTGPTRTNVNDFRAVLICAGPADGM